MSHDTQYEGALPDGGDARPARKKRWIKLPLEPAAPWWDLPALTRMTGQYLFARAFGAEPDMPVLGIAVACELDKDGKPTYPQLERWALSLCSPDSKSDERKTIRLAVRRIVAKGLIVPLPEDVGFRLLYLPESYEAYRVRPCGKAGDGSGGTGLEDPQPSGNGASTVDPPSANGGPNVPAPSPNPAPTVHQPSPNPTPTVGGKSAESLGAETLKEREKKKNSEKERDTRARATPLQLAGSALFFAERFDARYQLVRRAPLTWGPENLDCAQHVGAFLDDPRLRLRGSLEENTRDLLDGYFGDPYAERCRFALKALAKEPEQFLPDRPARGGDDYQWPSPAGAYGAPTDVSTLGVTPPLGAAE